MVRRPFWTLCFSFIAITSLSGVPNAPTNLTAQVAGTTVTLSWTAPAGSVPGYVLEGGSSSGLSDLARAMVAPSTSFVAAGIPAGTYFVRVRAVDATGESAPSNEIVVTVSGPCTTPPNAPVNLTSTVTGQVVSLSWGPSGGCPASNYVLLAGSAPGLSNLAVANVGLATAVSASAPAGTYYVRAYAQNAFGFSGPSNEVVAQVSAPVNYSGAWTLTRTIVSVDLSIQDVYRGAGANRYCAERMDLACRPDESDSLPSDFTRAPRRPSLFRQRKPRELLERL